MSKVVQVFLVLVFYAVLAFSSRHDSSRSRWKRVINGYVPTVNKERPFEYEVVRYFAWIGLENKCVRHKKYFDGLFSRWWLLHQLPCYAEIEDEWCGGALIHPRIVQTAGHCVGSHILRINDPTLEWSPGRVYSVWEFMLVVFVGYTDVGDFRHPSRSRFYLLHPKFARLRNTEYDWLSHDYAWIILNSEVYKLEHWPGLVAPVMTTQALMDFSTSILRNQDVCLFAGFGAWKNFADAAEFVNTSASRYLRYGWHTTTSYYQCWYYLDYVTRLSNKKRTWKYTQLATWFCHLPLPGYPNVYPNVGDSGGPVHCNGRMLALLSGGKWQNTTKEGGTRVHVTRTMGLAFSLFENSANFRQFFVATIKYYARIRLIDPEQMYDAYPNEPARPAGRLIDPHYVSAKIEHEHHMDSSRGGCCVTHISFAISTIQIFLKIATSITH